MLHSIHLLNTGFCFQREFLLAAGARRATVAIPVYVAVLQHPVAGPILFDTGFAGHYLDATGRLPYLLMRKVLPVDIRARWTAAAQLSRLGIETGDIRRIVLSHLHNDHVAGLKDFPAAEIVCRRGGYEEMMTLSNFNRARKGFVPDLLPDNFLTRTSFIENLPAVVNLPPFSDCADLLGDGSILLIPLEGHCRGQVGALCTLADGRRLLLCADACYLSRSLRNGQGPPWMTQLSADNPRASQISLDRLRHFQALHPEIPIIPSHCGEAAQLFPEWFVDMPVYEGRPLAGVA